MGVPATPWEADLGSAQGRIAPASPAPAGTYVYQLGHEISGVVRQLAAGDYHQILQSATLTAGTKVLRVRATVRPPTTAPPAGTAWQLDLLVDGDAAATIDITTGAPRSLADIAANVANIAAGAHDFAVRLTLTGPAGTYDVELPGCAIDDLIEDATAARPGVINRAPEPAEITVPLATAIAFDLIETGASTPDASRTTVYVNGVAVFVGGTFSTGWATSSTYGPVTGLGTDVVRFNLVPDLAFGSEQVVTVRVISAVTSGVANALDTTWSFTTLDASAPTVVSAAALDATHIQVVFSESVTTGDGATDADALNPGNYAITLVTGAPAVTPAAATSGSVTGTKAEPFAIAPDSTILVEIDGEAAITAAIAATSASRTSGTEPYALADGDTLTFSIDTGAVVTKTFATGEFADIAQATAIEVSEALTTFLLSSSVPATSSALTDVTISSQRFGTSSSVNVTGGTANGALGFTTGPTAGTGNVANADAITVAEVKAIVEAVAAGCTVSDVGGAPMVASNRLGPASSIQMSGTAIDALGVDDALHIGTSGILAVAVGLSDDTVILELEDPVTDGATYQVAVLGVEDLAGNVIVAPNNAAVFIPATLPVVAGRRYELIEKLPQINRDLDVTGDFAKFIAIFQVVFDELLADVDRWTDILDVDLAPEQFVDAMLEDLGNPFSELIVADVDKRKLVRLLVPLYAQKGTDPGMVNAIRLLAHAEVTIASIAFEGIWALGASTLGADTLLGTSDLYDIYSFDVVSPVTLTEEQRSRIRTAVAFMRRAPCHLRWIVEPTSPPAVPDHWSLGASELGASTLLH